MSNVSPLQKAQEILSRPVGNAVPAPAVMSGNSRTADKFVVRLPDGMRERVGLTARSHHRSMNSEIINTLDMHHRLLDMGHGPLLKKLLQGEELPGTIVAAPERVRAGDPAVFNEAVWMVEKLEVKGNLVYATITRENPSNSLPESKTVRHSALAAFTE